MLWRALYLDLRSEALKGLAENHLGVQAARLVGVARVGVAAIEERVDLGGRSRGVVSQRER